ncbi:hypothetical protein FB451DRAFT_1162533 [Mycena latifolia]|nr:hypothetical protein FB451DRAFT_1162533 [Mycena latifolia]
MPAATGLMASCLQLVLDTKKKSLRDFHMGPPRAVLAFATEYIAYAAGYTVVHAMHCVRRCGGPRVGCCVGTDARIGLGDKELRAFERVAKREYNLTRTPIRIIFIHKDVYRRFGGINIKRGHFIDCDSTNSELAQQLEPNRTLSASELIMRTLSFLALSHINIASTLSCDVDGCRGICEYTSNCHVPMFEHVPGYCPGLAAYECCIATG